jgi:cell division protein FtsQ
MSALLRILAWTLALVLVALPVVALVNGWIGADRWPLRTLRVQGDLQRVDAGRVRETVLPFARRGFFAVRLSDAQAAVAKLPWVERAEVHKRWPDVLEVRIAEHRPFAHWGGDRLLSEHGRIFPRGELVPPKDLPRLQGPDARVADVVALYNEARELFAPQSLKVAALSLDARGSWSLVLSDGSQVVVGKNEARLRLQRFARLLPQLRGQQPAPAARADLRYTNGFALVWKEQGAEARSEATGSAEQLPRRTVANRNKAARSTFASAMFGSPVRRHFLASGPRPPAPSYGPST